MQYIHKRLNEIIDYTFEVLGSDRTDERKLELVESSLGLCMKLIGNDLDALFYFGVVYTSKTVEFVRMRSQPIPRFKEGVVVTDKERIEYPNGKGFYL
jgi:hypothetical protein